MNFDNSHRQRQNHNNKRNRGRNNRRSSGGGNQHGGGGNSINRVYESNGPDVKVRGTAQTIAEKYMQLGRDAHSSGDNVMAESYYQFAEHYFRVLQSVQPPGQLAPQILRRPGEDSEEEVEGGEGDEAHGAGEGGSESGFEGSASSDEGEGGAAQGEAGQQGQQPTEASQQRQDRNNEPRGDGQQRERFRPRWQQQRRDRDFQPRDGQPRPAEGEVQAERQNQNEAPAAAAAPEQSSDWEAPSFLKRPLPPVESSDAPDVAEPVKPRRGRKPAATETGGPVED